MPELPEVETVCRGLHSVLGSTIQSLVFRTGKLREPLPVKELQTLAGAVIRHITRRGKYILIHTSGGVIILHLGMSGHLLLLPIYTQPTEHDHVDIKLHDGRVIRYHDPRRFGNIQFTTGLPEEHKLLQVLGPEPLTPDFNADWIYDKTRNRTRMIRDMLLDAAFVAGIGNIYAAEILFAAGILPTRPAGGLKRTECSAIAVHTVKILQAAIRSGGTSIRDYRHTDGGLGGYASQLNVYGRAQANCRRCQKGKIRRAIIHGRSVYYCPVCQK